MSKKFFTVIALCFLTLPVFAGGGEGTWQGSIDCAVYGGGENQCYVTNAPCAGPSDDFICAGFFGDDSYCLTEAGACWISCDECDSVSCPANSYWDGSECVVCPNWGDTSPLANGQSPENSQSITACYIPANTEAGLSDSTGTGRKKFTAKCNYSN